MPFTNDKLSIVSIRGLASNTATIIDFVTIFSTYRNPILCWYCDQSGNAVNLFVVHTGSQSTEFNLAVINIVNSQDLTVSISNNDLLINGVASWGRGIAIGYNPN